MSLLRATDACVALISILFLLYVRMHAETFGLRPLRLRDVCHAYSGYFIRPINVNYVSISLREIRPRFMTQHNVPDLAYKCQRNFIQS